MRFKTVLVDDEPLALARLRRLLEPYADAIEIAGAAESGVEAVELINDLRPDVVFMDIEMPELNAFDVLERLDYTPLVIFSTAYDRYALKAFEVHSIDYLVKPVDPARLRLAVDKLRRLAETGTGDLRERVRKAIESIRDPHKQRIQVRIGDRIKLIGVSEVLFFQASDKYVEVHTRAETYLITRSLSRLETELPVDDFVRVHRSTIVNINFIDEITRSFGGSYEVRLKDAQKTTLPVSRRYKSRLDLG